MTSSKSSQRLETAQEYATHTFCSLFTFSDAAVEEIFTSFKALATQAIGHECPDGQMFSVTCPKNDDNSFPALFEIIKDFIEKENGKSVEDVKVTRLKDTIPRLDAIPFAEVTNRPLALINSDLTTADTNAPLIEHETVTRTWVSRGRDKAKLSDYVMSKIGSICHCRIEWSKESASRANVMGDNEQDVERAIFKLSVMEETAIEQMSFPRIISFLIAESEFQSSFKLRMTALRMLQAHDDCRGSNTLLSPASKFYRSVNDALVITMIKNDALIKPNRRPDACKDGKDSSLVFTESESRQDTCQELLWGGYPLKMFKTLDEQMHVRAPPLNPATGSPTQTWVEHAPAPTEMADPYLPEDKKAILAPARPHRTLQEVVENRSKLGDPTPIKKPTTKRARAVKGDIAKSKSAKVKPIMEIDFDDSLPQQHSLQKKDFRMPLSDVAHIEQSKIGKVNTNSQDRKFNESNGGEETAAEDPVQLSTQYHEVNADKEDQILAADRSLEAAPRDIITPGITAPYMPSPLSSIWRPTANSIGQGRSDDPWGGKIVRGSSGPLVDLFTDGTHTKDSPRARPRPTMDQKAPSRGLLGGKNALLKDFRDAAKQLLTLALPRQGPVVFEVAIGRLLINHQVGSAEFKTKPFSLSEWFSAFPIKPGPGRLETRFTPRLTTSFKDIETILNTRLPKARRLFEDDTLQQPVLRTVTYVFSCKSKQGKLVTIELDEDRAYRILGGELLLGSLDFHFPKRSWDASLRLKTSSLRSVDYGRQAESIANNLTTQISLDGTFLSLVTQIDDEELIIQTIVVRRETYHPSKVYADILLRLCEVQDFQACREGHRYEGTIINRESMIEAGRYWWEASLTSTDARTILRVNDELEIGDVAAWDPETIIEKGIVDDLFCLSNDLVTRIDSVGLHNKALKGNSSSRTNKTSVKPSEALPGEGYW